MKPKKIYSVEAHFCPEKMDGKLIMIETEILMVSQNYEIRCQYSEILNYNIVSQKS